MSEKTDSKKDTEDLPDSLPELQVELKRKLRQAVKDYLQGGSLKPVLETKIALISIDRETGSKQLYSLGRIAENLEEEIWDYEDDNQFREPSPERKELFDSLQQSWSTNDDDDGDDN